MSGRSRVQLGLDRVAHVLVIVSEGVTDPDSVAAVVGDQ